MSWDHGRDVPAWNSTLMPAEHRLELGAGPPPVTEDVLVLSTPTQRGRVRPRIESESMKFHERLRRHAVATLQKSRFEP